MITLAGVKGITNNITIKSDSDDALEKKHVEDALKRHWAITASGIAVTASGTTITLTGTVSSLYQKEGRIAWATPGVWTVDNELAVEYDYDLNL